MTQSQQISERRPADAARVLVPERLAAALTVESYGLTDLGRVRSTNEDQFVTATLMRALWVQQSSVPQSPVHYADDRGSLFVVADGVGGAEAGEKASALAVGVIEEFLLNALRWLFALDGSAGATVLAEFKAALQSADACVHAASARDADLRGMGTTLTMAYSRGSDLFIAHVGDSRCYLVRGGKLVLLTRDDTLTNELVEGGALLPEDVAAHPYRHVITNVIGGPKPGVRAAVHRMKIQAGDTLVLCTDGLTGMVTDERISEVIAGCTGARDACVELVRLANDGGGEDNVTVIVARYS